MADPGLTTEDHAEDDVPESRANPLDWFRSEPARVFGVLGSLLFLLGWAGVVYVAFNLGAAGFGGTSAAVKVQIVVGMGSSVTLASALLWVVAVLIWAVGPDPARSASSGAAELDG